MGVGHLRKRASPLFIIGGGNAEALDGLFQRVDVHGLGQMRVHAGLLALFHILKEGVCGQRLRPVRTGSCVDSPIKVVTLYSSIMLKPFQVYFEFLAIICIKNREEIWAVWRSVGSGAAREMNLVR